MNGQEHLQSQRPRLHPEFTTSRERFDFTAVFQRNPWAGGLLVEFGRILPGELEGSMRVAYITAATLNSLDGRDKGSPFQQFETDAIVLGGALQDIGKGTEPQEMREKVYANDVRWREDPHAWQWDVVQEHPRKSRDLVLSAIRDSYDGTGYHVAQIVSLHHALKRENPYPGTVNFDTYDDFIKFGLQIVVAADVADAISKNDKGQGRAYLQDEEFADRGLQEILQHEVVVGDQIAQFAVEHALRLKGKINP